MKPVRSLLFEFPNIIRDDDELNRFERGKKLLRYMTTVTYLHRYG